MSTHRWLGAIILTGALATAGCGRPPNQGGAGTTTTTTTTTTTNASPTAVATTPAATASAAATGTPGATGSPVASASGSPGAAGDEADFQNAEGMAGYEEVAKLTPPPSTPDSIAKGKEVFAGAGNCVSCHGPEGKGDGPAGTALDPPPRNLHAKDEFKYGAGPRGVYRTVQYGVEGTGMAPLDGVLTPEQMWQVVHYVQTLEGT